MQISDKGIALIKKYEGVRLQAYKPVAAEQYWTIGYGHYGADVYQGEVITLTQAEQLLRADLVKFEGYVNALNRTWTQNQFDALTSFCYNCGSGSLQTLCKNRTAQVIAEKMLLYVKGANGKTLQGLVTRRNEERALFLTGDTATAETAAQTGYIVGHNYTTQVNLRVRTGAGTSYPAKAQNQLTASAQAHALNGVLAKGTRVTVQEVATVGSDTWVRIPSGWIAAIYNGKTYLA